MKTSATWLHLLRPFFVLLPIAFFCGGPAHAQFEPPASSSSTSGLFTAGAVHTTGPVVGVGAGTGDLGTRVAGNTALWLAVSPTVSNYALSSSSIGDTTINASSGQNVTFAIANVSIGNASSTTFSYPAFNATGTTAPANGIYSRAASVVTFSAATTGQWEINSSGELYPLAHQSIGDSTTRVGGISLQGAIDSTSTLACTTATVTGLRLNDTTTNAGLFTGSSAGTTTNSLNMRGGVTDGAGVTANTHANTTALTAGDDRYLDTFFNDNFSTVRARLTSAGTLQTNMGLSTTTMNNTGTASVDTTARQPASCAGNVDFANPYSVASNALGINGKGVRFHFTGTTAANANAKSIRVMWGSQAIVTKALTATTAGSWEIEGECHRSGASTQQCWARAFNNQGTTVALTDGATVLYQLATLSGTQTDSAGISLRVQEVTCTATTDITQTHARISFDN